ncbi:MAG: TonB-dependent receptor [Acidimicrobiia bacterium]
MVKKLFGVVIILAMLAAAPAFAQTTGRVRGEVVDGDGIPLAGVIVEMTGEALGDGKRGTVSASNGAFSIPGIPVGIYSLTATHVGFSPQDIDGINVNIGAVTSVTFHLQPTFAGEIAVVAESPVMDVTSPSVGATYDEDFVKDLPTRRNFYDLISASPGVFAPSGEDKFEKFRISAFGSNVQSGAWNIDGVNMTAPEGGYLFFEINPDAIAETQFLGVGAGAEYGSTAGSVFNVVTKSGTNQFHGSASAYLQDDSLVDPNVTVDDSPSGEFHVNDFSHLSATLGGPIKKDKFWFFAAYLTTVENISQPYESPELMNDTEDTRYDLKLTAQLTQNHRLDVKFSKDETFHPWPYDDTIYAPSTWRFRTRDNQIINGEYSGILSANTLLQISGGYWSGDNGDLPTSLANRDQIHWRDYDVSPVTQWGGVYWDWIWEQHHTQADVVLTHFAADFGGDHEFKFGVQYNQGGGTTTTYDTDMNYYWYGYVYKWAQIPYMYGGDTTTWSGFATDSWQISNQFTLNVGIRHDQHKASIPAFDRLDINSDPTGETIPGMDMFTWNQWSPRLGFAWQVTDDGKTVIRGSAGIYYDGTVSGNWYAPPPEAPPYVYSYWSGTEWVDWQVLQRGAGQLIQDGMEGPKTNELTLGVEHQIGDDMAVGAQFVYKDTKNMIGWHFLDDGVYEPFTYTDPDTGQTLALVDIIEWPTVIKGNSTGPGAVGGDRNYSQDYRGAFLTFKKRYSNGWDMMASYTYSKAEGLNTRPESNALWGQTAPFWTSYGEGGNPNLWTNAEGLLASDRTHTFRVSGNVDLGWRVKLSGVLRYQTGSPYNLMRSIADPTGQRLTVISSLNDDGDRYPSQTVLDLALGKHFGLGGWGDFSLDLQLLNVLNEDAGISWQTVVLDPGADYVAGDWVWPRRLTVRFKLSF